MTTILLVVLFISQLLTFYFLVILNTKLSKYKDIEKKQEAIIREMDDAISAYLVEVKDENDRLIKELMVQSEMKKSVEIEKQESTENKGSLISEKTAASTGDMQKVDGHHLNLEREDNHAERVIDVPKIVPKTIAATAYKKQLPQTQPVKSVEQIDEFALQQQNPVDHSLSQFEQEVVGYHRLGMSIEDIAKKTQKGKTEIELLIKFHA